MFEKPVFEFTCITTMEKDIEKRLKKDVEKLGWKCLKFVSPGTAGMPDRICLRFHGLIVFVELKSDRGVCSPLQLIAHRQLSDLGFAVYLVWDDHTLKNFLHDLRTLGLSGPRL